MATTSPMFTDDEARSLRLILGLAVGRDRVSVEAKKHLDGRRSRLPDSLKNKMADASAVIREAAAR